MSGNKYNVDFTGVRRPRGASDKELCIRCKRNGDDVVREGTVEIDGDRYRWMVYLRYDGMDEDPHTGEQQLPFKRQVRIYNLGDWRKRKDAKLIRQAIFDAINTDEVEKLKTEVEKRQKQ